MDQIIKHPIDVLEQFETSKNSIKLFADLVIDEVKEGRIDPLKVKALCKSMEQVIEIIDKNTKDEQRREAEKFGDKPFANYGCEMHYTSTKTEYDYKACNDAVYDRLIEMKENIDKQLKTRQEWLKMMGGQEILVDPATGEQYTAYPPIKKTSMGIKISIK